MFRNRLLTVAVQYRDRKGAAEQASRKRFNQASAGWTTYSASFARSETTASLPSDLRRMRLAPPPWTFSDVAFPSQRGRYVKPLCQRLNGARRYGRRTKSV